MIHGAEVEPSENGDATRVDEDAASEAELCGVDGANAEYDLAEAARHWHAEADQADDA